MKYTYAYYEIRKPPNLPTENGVYYGKTPILEQALNVARSINGILYGITTDGTRVLIFYD